MRVTPSRRRGARRPQPQPRVQRAQKAQRIAVAVERAPRAAGDVVADRTDLGGNAGAIEHLDRRSARNPGCASSACIRCVRASSSCRDRHTCTPPGWRNATSSPSPPAAARAGRGHSRAERCVHAPYAGIPKPLPCTQMSPKLPRAARCATSPSSRSASRAAEVAQSERDRRADEPAADHAIVEPLHASHARKAQDRRNLRGELGERVVAAAAHVLVRAAVVRDGLAIVEHFVAGLDQQEIALGPRDARRPRAPRARRSAPASP